MSPTEIETTDVIRDDERRKAEEQLEALLLEGMRGEKSELTRQDFEEIRRDALARLKSWWRKQASESASADT